MDSVKTSTARWYDRFPNLSTIVNLSRDFPKETQERIAEGVINVVYSYQDFMVEPKSLGAKVVMQLHRSGLKRRWYDEIPQLHRAFNMMITLPEAYLHMLEKRYKTLAEEVLWEKQRLDSPSSTPGALSAQSDESLPGFKRPSAREVVVDVDIVDGEGLLRERRVPPES